MHNGQNRGWEYVKQPKTSSSSQSRQNYENEYQDENEDNGDESYECSYMEEDLQYYSNSEEFLPEHEFYPEEENQNEKYCQYSEIESQFELPDFQSPRYPLTQSAPGFISYESHSNSLLNQNEEDQEYDEDYAEDEQLLYHNSNSAKATSTNLLDCTNNNENGWGAFEELVDFREDLMNTESFDFDQSQAVKPTRTWKEQVQSKNVLKSVYSTANNTLPISIPAQNSHKKPKRTTRKIVNEEDSIPSPKHSREQRQISNKKSSNANSSILQNHDDHDNLRSETTKAVPYRNDPEAAGDSPQVGRPRKNVSPNNFIIGRRAKHYNLEEREIISATHSFKQPVPFHLPQQPEFTLEDKLSPGDCTNSFKSAHGGNMNIDDGPRSLLLLRSLDDGHLNSKDNAKGPMNPSIMLPTYSSLDKHRLNNPAHLSYEPPILQGNIPASHPHPSNSNYFSSSWHKMPNRKEDRKLSPFFRESCISLWSHNLHSPYAEDEWEDDFPFPRLPSRSQSETNFKGGEKRNLTAQKKIQFTYTSHESFFSTNVASNADEVKPFQEGSETGSLTEYSSSTPTICPIEVFQMESVGAFTSTSSADDLVAPDVFDDQNDNCSSISSTSSSSSLNFIVFPKTFKSSGLGSSPQTTSLADPNRDLSLAVCPVPNLSLLDSTSYTILKPCASQNSDSATSSDPKRSRSTQESYDASINTSNSGASTPTFASFNSPPRPCNSRDSNSVEEMADEDYYFERPQMTDKMDFKFMLDENGSEVQISVTLPFPVPNSDLGNIESPYMAAAILQKAQELVLQNAGFMGHCGCGGGGDYGDFKDSPNMDYFEWVEQDTNSEPPVLEISISMEELLSGSHPKTRRNIAKNKEGKRFGGVCRKNAKNVDDSKFLRFLSNLFLCGWCRSTIKTFPENTENPDCNKRDGTI